MINYLEFVLPRWIWCGMFILLYINLRCLDLPELEGIEIPTDIIIANLCLFFFAYITLLGWGMLKIISLAPEVVERVFNAIIGKYDKD